MNRSKQVAEILEKYSDDIATSWPFYIKGEMPSDNIDNAMRIFANGIDRKRISGLYDTSLFNKGKCGFLFTDQGIYYKDTLSSADRLLYDDIERVELGPKASKEENRSIYFYLKNGSKEEWNTSYLNKAPLKDFFDELLPFLYGNEKEKIAETKKDENKDKGSDLTNRLKMLSEKF